ncbi:MAG TPA: hypothetical protein PLV45_13455 [bacterium]|nr:hypothetical protein [bacterium]
MSKRVFVVLVCVCACFIATGSALAATYRVDVDAGGFYPDNITINYGDSVDFYNYTGYSLLTIFHVSGPCSNWIIDVPNYGHTEITFNCGPGTENYQDAAFGFTGIININPPPTATPTPDPNLPSTTSTGILITIVLMSVLMAVPVFRK